MKIKETVLACGSCIAFYIGAGFATMQEIMQYEASYGSFFWIVITVTAAIYLYTNLSFAINAKRCSARSGNEIYSLYCGKKIGLIFDFFSALFCYMSFIVMCGGASSTFSQQWGLPSGMGAVVLVVAVVLTVLFGFDGILSALSTISPIIIVFIIAIAAFSFGLPSANFVDGVKSISEGAYAIIQIGNGNPLASGTSYGGFVILWFAAFIAQMSRESCLLKSVNRGIVLSALFIFGVAALCCVALISNIALVWNADIPALSLANGINPVLGTVFAVVICLGIYTSAVPLLWTGIHRVSREGTTRYKLVTVFAGIAGCLIACFVPYAPLLNVLYGINGYLGFILVGFMIVHDVRFVLRSRLGTMP